MTDQAKTEAEKHFAEFVHVAPSNDEKPIYGTTIYIGKNEVETAHGPFTILTYQDLIHKGYILALVKGDVHQNKTIYTRLHSSCVTSETLGSLDCDCVQQLNGALEVISQKPCGILFYLIQEGRGCGYVGKSRDRMMVQYHNDKITTFDAYRMLGMQKDYRNYRNIADICHILDIHPDFILLTNNPDKIEGLRNHGLNVQGVENIEVPPNPFNQQYLTSKQQSGHLLMLVKNKVQSFVLPTQPPKPFVPYSIAHAPRFVHVSSYYLPIKPKRSLMSQAEYESMGILLPYELSHDGEFLVEVTDASLYEKFPHLLRRPYWFQVHVYYDIQTQTEFVVLEYKDCKNSDRPPLVRIHSESIFSRFPLKKATYRKKYQESIHKIVKNGVGLVILFYHDGKGHGLGTFVIESDENSKLAHEKHAEISRRDVRDFGAAAILLRHHIGNAPFTMLYSQETSKKVYQQHFGNVYDWEWIGDAGDSHGQQLLANRNEQIGYLLSRPNNSIHVSKPLDKAASYSITGIGSSEAHGRFLAELLKEMNINAHFFPIATPISSLPPNEKLIVFSQGMSPHTQTYVERADVLFTAVTENNKDAKKVALLKKVLERGGTVVTLPLEDEYDVLIRVIGPFFGFVASMHFAGKTEKIPSALYLKQVGLKMPPLQFSETAMTTGRLSILVPSSLIPYVQNIVFKWVEGVYFSPPYINDYMSWIHGAYQSVSNNKLPTPHILFHTEVEPIDAVTELLGGQAHPIWPVKIQYGILEIESILNYWIFFLMNRMQTQQRNWTGKQQEGKIYNSRYV